MKMPRYLGPGLVRAALVAQDDAVDDHLLGDRAAPGAAGESVVIARDPDDARRRGLGMEPCRDGGNDARRRFARSEEHTSELQSLMRSSYAVLRLTNKNKL